MKKTSFAVTAIIGLILSLGAAAPVAATEAHPAFASIAGQTSIPVGHAEFCQRLPHECQPMERVDSISLTDALWRDLQEVNNHFNTTVTPASDRDIYGVDEFWTFPSRGYGDCEDFALGKRAALIERGWPASTLLVSVVMQANGEGHAVLMVRTDRGDLVLDNQEALIKIWTDTPYTFLKRQSQAHSGQWVDILDARDGIVTATAGY
jgi:predicted transglutaminase-like cysteine proteinase